MKKLFFAFALLLFSICSYSQTNLKYKTTKVLVSVADKAGKMSDYKEIPNGEDILIVFLYAEKRITIYETPKQIFSVYNTTMDEKTSNDFKTIVHDVVDENGKECQVVLTIPKQGKAGMAMTIMRNGYEKMYVTQRVIE